MVRTAPIGPAALLDPVVDYFHPRRIILFGSVARGESGSNSDYDLMVILDDDAPREKVSLAAGFEARRSFKQAADVIPCREAVFLRKARIPVLWHTRRRPPASWYTSGPNANARVIDRAGT